MAKIFFRGFINFMDISFNGIYNLDIKTFKAQGYGHYLDNAMHITHGPKDYTIVSLRADLDNSVIKGENTAKKSYKPHLKQYTDALRSLNNIPMAKRILDFENQNNKVEIIMKHFHAPDNLGDINQASFMLNGEQIPITERNILPLYTFMARLTRDITKFFNISPQTKESVKLMNNSIAQNAEEFIDNMVL